MMRSKTNWTAEMDKLLKALRETGQTWDGIAAAMGLGRNTVLERGRKTGARRIIAPSEAAVEEAKDRAPRGAGHPSCWTLLTDGTPLDGSPYPYPVFL